ncbi:hypothetical protein C8J57DRAFT_1479202 [Mycena rebaudengoi]|nr:hypothetical protein C8J57DRAFT_1479202 [Mycena rebaudengoi]
MPASQENPKLWSKARLSGGRRRTRRQGETRRRWEGEEKRRRHNTSGKCPGLIELGYSPSPHGISASILNQAIASVNQWAWACNGFRLQSRTIHYHKKSVAGYHTEKNVQCTVKQGHRPPKARKLKDWLEQLEGLKERQIVEVLSLEACLKRSLLGNLEIELHPAADYESQATPRAQIRVVRYDGLRGRLENDLRGGLKTWWWEEERGNHVKSTTRVLLLPIWPHRMDLIPPDIFKRCRRMP